MHLDIHSVMTKSYIAPIQATTEDPGIAEHNSSEANTKVSEWTQGTTAAPKGGLSKVRC